NFMLLAPVFHPRSVLPAFIIVRHVMTVPSVSLSFACICIVLGSRALTRVYAILLTALLVNSITLDIVLQLIFDPSYQSRMRCIYRRDPLINIPMSAAMAS
ncbi:hypothetical protein PMAYCL1PPCAC_10515, partial [Pristionchus mayeri]